MNPIHDIFLSHNSTDKTWTERLATALEADKSGPPLKIFFDKWDIRPGSDIPAELEAGIQNSRYVGLVLSPEALASNWVSLERSTAIYRDPTARAQRLIPLLHRTCVIPDMLARLSYIDFRREDQFDSGVELLVNVLRGRPLPRGVDRDLPEIYFQHDAELLRAHRQIFDRAAFSTSCIHELFITELSEAIDDTLAALATGSLYSRSDRLLKTFPDRSDYLLPEFREAFSRIVAALKCLKQEVVRFEVFFRNTFGHDPGDGMDFFRTARYLCDEANKAGVRASLMIMDEIDKLRNEVIAELNVLLKKCGLQTFDSIELSSVLVEGTTNHGIHHCAFHVHRFLHNLFCAEKLLEILGILYSDFRHGNPNDSEPDLIFKTGEHHIGIEVESAYPEDDYESQPSRAESIHKMSTGVNPGQNLAREINAQLYEACLFEECRRRHWSGETWLVIYAKTVVTESQELDNALQGMRIPASNRFARIFILHVTVERNGGYRAHQIFPELADYFDASIG
jgi:hypothetical protein